MPHLLNKLYIYQFTRAMSYRQGRLRVFHSFRLWVPSRTVRIFFGRDFAPPSTLALYFLFLPIHFTNVPNGKNIPTQPIRKHNVINFATQPIRKRNTINFATQRIRKHNQFQQQSICKRNKTINFETTIKQITISFQSNILS